MPAPAPILRWSDAQDALVAWVRAATGAEAIWAEQSAARPDYPYSSLSITSVVALGGPAELRYDADTGRPQGQEIRRRTVQPSTLSLSVQTFTVPTIDDAAAFALLQRARLYLEDPDVRANFRAAGLGLIEAGPVQRIPTLVQTRFEGRAQLDVRLSVVDGLVGFLGYISTLGPVGATYS